jgi:hypothetical protein
VANEAALAVDACVGWHDAWMHACGLKTAIDPDAWRLLANPPRAWYFAAITRRPDAPADALAKEVGMVCDAWSRLDLEPFGFRRQDAEPWFFRPAGPLEPEAAPIGLEIVRAASPREIEEFEAVSVRGFENEGAWVEVGSVHPAAILADARMTCWIGRVAGRPVAAAMSFRTKGAIGVFGVTTVASERKRGYGTAVTRAAIQADSGLPSVLSPSPEGERLYRRLGFEPVGALQKWWRTPPGTDG